MVLSLGDLVEGELKSEAVFCAGSYQWVGFEGIEVTQSKQRITANRTLHRLPTELLNPPTAT
jgi:hypothetical protein